MFSAVICCGLIEAPNRWWSARTLFMFSAVICCGLIEARIPALNIGTAAAVFRSDMLRPH